APEQGRHGDQDSEQNGHADQRCKAQTSQGVCHQQGKGKGQQPETGAGGNTGKGVPFGREIAGGPAQRHDECGERDKAGGQLGRNRNAQQGDQKAGEQNGDQQKRRNSRQGFEQGARLARHDAVGPEQGEGQG